MCSFLCVRVCEPLTRFCMAICILSRCVKHQGPKASCAHLQSSLTPPFVLCKVSCSLSLSLLLNVMLFCMCIFNDISNTQGTPLHLALPQIYIFHIYTGPKFTQIPDLHGTHIYTGLFSHIDPKKQIYTNQLYTKPKFTQNLFFKFCIKLYQVNSSELDIFGYFLFAKKSPKNDIKCTF